MIEQNKLACVRNYCNIRQIIFILYVTRPLSYYNRVSKENSFNFILKYMKACDMMIQSSAFFFHLLFFQDFNFFQVFFPVFLLIEMFLPEACAF